MTTTQNIQRVQIGLLIRNLRQRRGWSQTELARRAECTRQTVHSIETSKVGTKQVPWSLAKIEQALGLPVNFLVSQWEIDGDPLTEDERAIWDLQEIPLVVRLHMIHSMRTRRTQGWQSNGGDTWDLIERLWR